MAPRPFAKLILALGILVTLGAAGMLYWQHQNRPFAYPPELTGLPTGEPRVINPFQLNDHNNQPFTLTQLQGRWTFLFFGYTHCPDICPTAMGVMSELFRLLKEKNPALEAQSRGVFVSVDPERDNPTLMKGYVTFFNPGFLGVTAAEGVINNFARQFGAGYVKQAGEGKEGYQIAHTTTLFLVDPKGRLTGLFAQPHDPARIADQFMKIQQLFQGDGR